MANNRVFQAQALTTNGIAVGGVASIGFDAAYKTIVQSGNDGAFGVEDVDKALMAVTAALQCSDVTKGAAILDAAVGSTVFSGKESGVATWSNYTVASIVWNAMNLMFAKEAEGTLGLNGRVRFADGTKKLADVIALSAGQTAPSLTSPAPLYRPSTASFDPEGADPAITPVHTESISLSLNANLLSDASDTDVGETAVDREPFGPLEVTLVHRDALAVSPGDISAALLDAVAGVLTVALLGRGGAADKTLTINNMQWTGVDRRDGPNYTDFTLRGIAGWTKRGDPDVNYDLNATPLFTIA